MPRNSISSKLSSSIQENWYQRKKYIPRLQLNADAYICKYEGVYKYVTNGQYFIVRYGSKYIVMTNYETIYKINQLGLCNK